MDVGSKLDPLASSLIPPEASVKVAPCAGGAVTLPVHCSNMHRGGGSSPSDEGAHSGCVMIRLGAYALETLV